MRSSVPPASDNRISSGHSFFRPTRGVVAASNKIVNSLPFSGTRYCVYRVPDIVSIGYMIRGSHGGEGA